MKLRYKILNGVLAVLVIAVFSLGLLLSRSDACGPAPEVDIGIERMKAAVARCYGSPDIVTIEEVAKPQPARNEVLVKVRAASVNPLDWHYMRGSPYLMRLGSGIGTPADARMGVDFAGTIEAVGADVTRFQPGDEVFGGRSGAFAEYVTIRADGGLAAKPANVSFEQAASVPIAAITALQALRDKGKLDSRQRVLINGASGGVGTFAVQIAKHLGAEVSGVCSTRNVDMVRSLGADHVVDYTQENYWENDEQYDLIIDNVVNRSISENRRVLKPDGTYVIVGGAKGDWLGPFVTPLKALLMGPFVDQELVMILAELRGDDLALLADLMASGFVTAVIDRRYSLDEVPEAIRYSESGRARGKIIITME